MKPAFVVIDMQNRHVASRPTHPDLRDAVELINWVAGLFRAAGRPVIWVQDREGLDVNEPGFAIVDGLLVEKDERRVVKEASNAFREPELERALAETGSDFALLAGFAAEGCVLATARGADDRGIAHALLRGAVVSRDPEAPGLVERISPLVSYEVVTAMLRG